MSPVSKTTKALRLCTTALAVCAITAPATFAYAPESNSPSVESATAAQDLRSPDAVDAATPRLDAAVVKQDLRSPDAVDAATPRLDAAVVKQDLRSPDAVDAATPRLDGTPDGTGVQSTVSEASGFDWSSAGVATAALIGLLVASVAAASLVRTRRTVARP